MAMTTKLKLKAEVYFVRTSGHMQGVPRRYAVTQEVPFGNVTELAGWFEAAGIELVGELQPEVDSIVEQELEERRLTIDDERI